MQSIPRARIFLSSPGDVAEERAAARVVIERLRTDPLLRDEILIEAVAWDDPDAATPMLATMTPQAAINAGLARPSECDIVVVILWSRMGTPLPADMLKPDGARYQSGTEWEYLDALNAPRATPDDPPYVVVYRRSGAPQIALDDKDFDAKTEQWRRVQNFFAGFSNADGSLQAGYHTHAAPDDFSRQLEGHLKQLLKRVIDAHKRTTASAPAVTAPPSALEPTVSAPLWDGSPFPGLRAFTPADGRIYFGRGAETDAVVDRLRAGRLLAVVGASGSGKSSLIGAGLIPRLKANAIDGAKDWLLPDYTREGGWTGIRFTPGEVGDNPFMALANKLHIPMGWNARELNETLVQTPSAIHQCIHEALKGRPRWAELLIFIDQFEELFTLCDVKYREPFARMLETAIAHRARVVLTVRADFFGRAIEIPALESLLRDATYPLGKPGTGALYEMITRPADAAGLTFEPGLPQRMLDDTGDDPGGLALLAYALDQLVQTGKLSRANYDRIGGVQGAIGDRAQGVFAGLPDVARTDAVFAAVFLHLVEVDERGAPTRRRARLDTIAGDPAARLLVDRLTDARLLVTSGQGTDAYVEVAHEALLRSWDRLRVWIDGLVANLRLWRRLQAESRVWQEAEARKGELVLIGTLVKMEGGVRAWRAGDAPRREPYLLKGLRLLEAQRCAQVMPPDAAIAGYIAASEAAERQHQREEQMHVALLDNALYKVERARRRARTAAMAVLLLILVAVGAGVFAIVQTNTANDRIALLNARAPGATARAILAESNTGFEIGWFTANESGSTNDAWQPIISEENGFDMVQVPAGCFMMGSDQGDNDERPAHQQCFDAPFWIDQTEVTQGQFIHRGEVDDSSSFSYVLPVENITWFEARDFCALRGARLPTESEWEYAARGPESLIYPWGNTFDGDRVVYRENSDGETAYVGSRPDGASWVGALHMAGNVWEWTSSAVQDYPYEADAREDSADALRVVRGGAFSGSPDLQRASNRVAREPSLKFYYVGFRCARSSAP